MKLEHLPLSTTRSKKRLGRGHGSGRGKTSGRGTKGQKARGTIPQDFEGGQLALTKRLPLLRGKGRNKSRHTKVITLTLSHLSALPAKTVVTLDALKKHGLIGADVALVKVLGDGVLTVALSVRVPVSKSAKVAIEKAGGTVVYV